MKNLRKYILIACSLFTLAACDLEIDITNPGLITEEKPDRPQAGETITYRAQVWVEKNDMEEFGYLRYKKWCKKPSRIQCV